mmetsp:Transcript_26970/g.54222  ORF Transcript_26970/g.54222 Transcript_26970/m.54222 type:complete len:233 (-) Transcript_26970:282-980(-)
MNCLVANTSCCPTKSRIHCWHVLESCIYSETAFSLLSVKTRTSYTKGSPCLSTGLANPNTTKATRVYTVCFVASSVIWSIVTYLQQYAPLHVSNNHAYIGTWPNPYNRVFWAFAMHCWTRAGIAAVAHIHYAYHRSLDASGDLPMIWRQLVLIVVILGCSVFSFHFIYRYVLNRHLGWHFLAPEQGSPMELCLNSYVPTAQCADTLFLSSLANETSGSDSGTYDYTYDAKYV